MVRVGFKASFDASQMLFHTPDGLLPLVDERCYNYLKPVVGPNVLRVLPWPTPGPGLPVAALVVPVMSQVGTSVLDKWVNPFEFVVGDWHRTPTALNAIRGLDDKTGLSRTDRWTNLADVVVLGNYLRHPWSNNHSEWKIHLTTRITMDLSALDEAGTGSRTLMERFAVSLFFSPRQWRRGRIWVRTAALQARFETARSWAIDRSRISSRYVVERAMSEIEIEVVDDVRIVLGPGTRGYRLTNDCPFDQARQRLPAWLLS